MAEWSAIRWATFAIVVFTLLVWIVWDIIAVVMDPQKGNRPAKGATISELILSGTRRFPWLLIVLGYILGHLTWPQMPTPSADKCEALYGRSVRK